jgi:cytosine/creatinine deaminase
LILPASGLFSVSARQLSGLLLRGANLATGQTGVDVLIEDGLIKAIGAGIAQQIPVTDAIERIDAAGQLLSPTFVDAHFHMDATLSYGQPRINQSGTLLEGIALWGELKPHLTQEALLNRGLAYCDWAVAQGLLAIRSHVDTGDPRLLAVEAMLELKKRVAPYLDLQLVAFPQDGVLRYQPADTNPGCKDTALDLLTRALDMGVEVVGGIPHFERTMQQGTQSVSLLCQLAADRGLQVDMHCDETDDPASRHIETLAYESQRLRLQGRVNASHVTSMHSMDNYYASKLLPLIAQAGVSVVANPLINITLQGRLDIYPKRRGLTRVPELIEQGVPVAFGHDCVMDPWYSFGSADMLEVAMMGLHVAQMTSTEGVQRCFDAVTTVPASIMGLGNRGLFVGAQADLVLLQASSVSEAMRLRARRLLVLRKGRVVARQAPASTELFLPDRPASTSLQLS